MIIVYQTTISHFCLNTEETKVERKERRKVTKLRQSKLCPALICSLI